MRLSRSLRPTSSWLFGVFALAATLSYAPSAQADILPGKLLPKPQKPAPRTKKPVPQAKKIAIPAPIATRRQDVTDVYHGIKVTDPYRWLEAGNSKEVAAWNAANHKRTMGVLRQVSARTKILQELKKLYNNQSSTSPRRHGQYYFFFRREGLKNQPILYVSEGSYRARPRALLDPNTLSKDGTVSVQQISPSPSGRFLAYALSAKGSDWSYIRVLNVATGKHLTDRIDHTRWPSVIWDRHGLGFYYVSYPPKGTVPARDKNYYRRIFYHHLGTSADTDALVFGEGRKKETWLDPAISSDRSTLYVSASVDWSYNDLYYRPINSRGPFLALARGLKGQFSADVMDGQMMIVTTYKAPRGRVLLAPLKDPVRKNWKTLIPQQKGVIQGVFLVKGHLLIHYMEDVVSRLALYTRKGQFVRDIRLPSKGSVSDISTRSNSNEIFYRFTSWIYPSAGYRYDLGTHKRTRLEALKIPVNLSLYETKQVFYPSKDGTRVPMFLVYRKGTKLDGNNPTELYGYGGFEVSLKPRFMPGLFPWLDRGGVFALANLRGGGEYGSAWHMAGRRAHKQNVYDDFIAAAEWLIKHRYTQPKRLAIRGGSNGGLLVSATMTQRPDLFGAVICQVPLTDMIRYPISTVARLWIPEYGNPQKANEFKWLWGYSPYHRLKKGTRYPITLVMTADHDDRVDPFHARKFAARLQANTTADRPVLLRIESKAGHGAGTPLSKALASIADRYAFLMIALGMDTKR
ncbi:MAG: S9 family peptidase [Myxococcales bacterium]|nr:S9 family peptidase [Myxococcales bacterium]MCB9641663.1 S9 family peptidase [Myxococcales bacterium]